MASDPKPRSSRDQAVALNALIERAGNGDEGAARQIRATLTELPGLADIGGNVADEAEKRLVATYAGKCLATREFVTQKLKNLRAELGGATGSPLEKLLIDRVVATWLHVSYLEFKYAATTPMDLAVAVYYQRAITAANKRHLAAIKALAEVRRLALPAIQVGPNVLVIDARGSQLSATPAIAGAG